MFLFASLCSMLPNKTKPFITLVLLRQSVLCQGHLGGLGYEQAWLNWPIFTTGN